MMNLLKILRKKFQQETLKLQRNYVEIQEDQLQVYFIKV